MNSAFPHCASMSTATAADTYKGQFYINTVLPVPCDDIYFQIRIFTGSWRTTAHRRGADTIATQHPKRIYHSGSSLLPQRATRSDSKRAIDQKKACDGHSSYHCNQEARSFISTNTRVLRRHVPPGRPESYLTSHSLNLGLVRITSPHD